MTPVEPVVPVTLWRDDGTNYYDGEWCAMGPHVVAPPGYAVYRALPADSFAALLKQRDDALAERDGFVKANVALDARLLATEKQRDDLRSALGEARDFLRAFANDIDDEQAWNMTARGAEAREIQTRIDALTKEAT